MSAGLFATVMVLWWTSLVITKRSLDVARADYSLGPEFGIFMLLTLPAGLGSWIYPIFQMVAGALAWWQIIGGVTAGLAASAVLSRTILPGDGWLSAGPFAVLCSFSGLGIVVWA